MTLGAIVLALLLSAALPGLAGCDLWPTPGEPATPASPAAAVVWKTDARAEQPRFQRRRIRRNKGTMDARRRALQAALAEQRARADAR